MTLLSPFRTPLKLPLRSFRSLLPGPSTAPLPLKARPLCLSYLLSLPPNMNPSFVHRIPNPDNPPTSDMSMRDATPILKFEDESRFASNSDNNMIFGPLEFDDGQQFSPELSLPWDSFEDQSDQSYLLDFSIPQSNALFDSGAYPGAPSDPGLHPNPFQWLTEPECPPLDNSSSPIPIRTAMSVPQTPPTFPPYVEHYTFPQDASFSPSDFAALHPLPRSISPSGFSDSTKSFPARFNNTHDITSLQRPPTWASQLWDTPSRSHSRSPASPRSSAPQSPLSKTSYAIKRQSFEARTRKSSLGQVFQSSSAPSPVQSRAPNSARPYSRRAESASVGDDHDATIRRKKRLTSPEAPSGSETPADNCMFYY